MTTIRVMTKAAVVCGAVLIGSAVLLWSRNLSVQPEDRYEQTLPPTPAEWRLLSLQGGDELQSGESVAIRWNPIDSIGTIKILLWNGSLGEWLTVADSISVTEGIYDWTVPTGLAGDRFRIKLQSADLPESRMSESYFTISPVPLSRPTVAQRPARPHHEQLTITPSQARDKITVRMEDGRRMTTITVLNAKGERVLQQPVDGERITIDVTELPVGSYFMQAVTPEGTHANSRFNVIR